MTDTQKAPPARMSITALVTGEYVEAEFNPQELEEMLDADWSELPVRGLSHQPMQYQHTTNHAFKFTLALRANVDNQSYFEGIQKARKFLLSCMYSSRATAGTISGGAPGRLLFVWPELISVTCVIKKLKFKHTLFRRKGHPIHSAVDVSISEIRDVRLYAEDVRANGTVRASR